MAHAYTPGLKVSRYTLIQKERRLPLPGEVLVKKGERIKAETVVAKTEIPGEVFPINIAGILGVSPKELKNFMLKKEEQEIKKNEIIAQSKGFFGLFKTKATSPIDGHIESVSPITGQAILRGPPIPIEVSGYIDGVVKEIIPKEGVIVETKASFIQGIFGVGGEVIGELYVACRNPEDELTPERISEDVKGKIIVGGSFVSYKAIERAREKDAKAIVVGGIDDENLKKFLGYDLGIAITGSEQLGITLIITEGYGRLPMAHSTFELLQDLNGKKTSCNGATQIRAGVIRPEVIVPLEEGDEKEEEGDDMHAGMDIGIQVRIIRAPYFGLIGKVVYLPPELRKIDTEAMARVVEVELDNGKKVLVPRANVEIMER